ncbi:MAG: large conductance mechanosensitive channel protein MscL [Spirosomataceae bacterium]
MFSEFRKFIAQGNVLDLAVGVIIGAAFGKIVASFVDDIIMPVIGALLQGVDFKSLEITVGQAHIKYGNFIQTVVDFLIVAYVIFLVVKAANKASLSEKKTDEKA